MRWWTRSKLAALLTAGGVSIAALGVPTCVSSPDTQQPATAPATQADPITPVAEAKSQDEAQRLAQESDLPQIAKADRVEVVVGYDDDEGPRVVFKVNNAAKFKALRNALKIAESAPVPYADEPAAVLIFYRGPAQVRKI